MEWIDMPFDERPQLITGKPQFLLFSGFEFDALQ